jgi:hypothetical protein
VFLFFVLTARKGGFFLLSPLLIIYVPFITGDLLPALFYARTDALPDNVQYVLISTIAVYVIFLLLYYKQFSTQNRVTLDIPEIWTTNKYVFRRKVFFIVLAGIFLLTGLITGVTKGLLTGADVEDLRRSSEIGIGFLRDIPLVGINVILLVYLISYCRKKIVKAAFICLSFAVFSFLVTGHKAGFWDAALLFTFYFCSSYRNLKWYEVAAYYSVMPVFAGLLQTIRQGTNNFVEHIIFYTNYSTVLFEANTLAVMRYFESGSNFYWGEQYVAGLVKFIPRFLWKDKPLSFDYTLKNLIGYEFDGGGTPISTPFSMFINFGYYNFIGLAIWLWIVHSIYGMLIDNSKTAYLKIALLFSLIFAVDLFLGRLEIMLLFLLVCMFVYGRKKMV